ncbi:MAG: anti-sigma factor family protein [Candidatus Entotheonellia bacterium]
MNCQTIREHLIEYLYHELAPEVSLRIEQHLRGCTACQAELASLQQVTATLDQWQVPAPPAGVVERTLACIGAEAPDPTLLGSRNGGPPAIPLLALALGGLAAGVSMGLTTHLAPQPEPPFMLAVLGILWAVLYGGLFVVALGHWTQLKELARVVLLAGGLAILLTPVLSIPEVVEACSAWAGVAKGSLVLNILLFIVGGLYSAIPLLIGHLVTGRAPDSKRSQGLASGLLYLVLVAPAFYLQCAALVMGTGTTWMAGAIVGVLAGGPAGIWLAGHRMAARA